jgi:WD40 repeat protein
MKLQSMYVCGRHAGTDGAVVWDASKGACQSVLQGHDAGMRWASIAPQGHLITASADGMIKKWSLDTASCLSTLPGMHNNSLLNAPPS